ncbi:hypothetical protein CIPAW_16G016000 [Carya illinoinensis]|uniref:Uncharacterized protein n=1 Tax=Carya illinoinensis TaxID=32201 RepID=A0A8T1N1H8_CARIL|nr:hypothetical protein CIPAW_16G016000 [Carya illinoinensis]
MEPILKIVPYSFIPLKTKAAFIKKKREQSGVDLYRLCLYISHARFRDLLDRCSCISPSISTNSPSVQFKACGARILYEHDMEEFIHILSQKGHGIRNSPTSQDIEHFKRRFLGDGTAKLQDFDGNSVYNLCSYKSIQKLFTSISKDPLVTFDSPKNWYKDGTCSIRFLLSPGPLYDSS